ncbi:hypothetical protein HBI56_227160 [Parastagonospora nodorum]|uniref:Uncharacterized protein n=2 Tax=Phaeosphaeria nodorum (strain SN15 / ATCC MYA-4574 / FGSC 10173) TaxID=321614 RepID=A0A7U2HZ30_PHANO|nr:hypothetical protein SNOG_15836 [Parastagonospora nodorum SN15]KAH3903778.1 hypothetical protein HBH56_244670 [Parastagonospora nodorum]EAT76674.1 hypothetical protein SNOG_15836 [Parastagonospora nodorum SN15]KAH3921062.1 hypothetical protein HBH54_246470 [Parastagonospora nodorum]KAH3939521.1 hypothetical protein HBH53_234210 [Parastagonospora nodorum]KAH3959004.1 hypothetical protein HBH51_202250 [Parastagonospora nodorum]
MASRYTGKANQGWSYESEAIQYFRSLELFREEACVELTLLDGELCRRAFWVLSDKQHDIYPENAADSTYTPADSTQSKLTISLSAKLRIIRKLQTTVEKLPKELKYLPWILSSYTRNATLPNLSYARIISIP